MTILFNWYGPELPVAVLQLIPSYLGLRIIFSKAMTNDEALRNPEYYSIEAIEAVPSSQIHNVDPWYVTPEPDVEYPTYVDLDCTDLTLGTDYRLTITPDVISTSLDELLTSGNNQGIYVGVSIYPYVQTVRPVSETVMEVIFNKEMSPIGDLLLASSYSFNKGLVVRDVTIIAPGTVHLLTTRQVPSELYTLTVISS
jgi:hypothetical protein